MYKIELSWRRKPKRLYESERAFNTYWKHHMKNYERHLELCKDLGYSEDRWPSKPKGYKLSSNMVWIQIK